MIFGYAAHEMIGGPIQRLFPPDRLDEEDVILARIRSGERVEHFETVRRCKDGSDVSVSITISPIRDASGTIVGASKIVRDISERQRAQAALVQARDELEHMVAQRTRALEERNLLLREVYHRVKNNLQVVDGMVMLQAIRIADPQARDALNALSVRIQALGLVHQQLMGSHDLKTFDVAAFLNQLVDNIAGGAADEGVTLSVDAVALPVGLDFAIPLGLVVTELVTNALKHAFPDRTGAVAVGLQQDGDQLILQVRDDGPEAETAATGAGLGAGLVRQLVAQMGGAMTAHRNGGTEVTITVPLSEVA